MNPLVLTRTRIQSGIYEAVVKVDGSPPRIGAVSDGAPIGSISLSPDPEDETAIHIRVELPREVMTEGVQTILIIDEDSGETLDSFSVLTGQPIDDDLRGEIDLLRAELDMLKKAFRRHCLETGS